MADGFSGFLQDNARSHLGNVPFSSDLVLNRPIIAEALRRSESAQAITFVQQHGTFGSLTFRGIDDKLGPDVHSLCGKAEVVL